MDAKPVHSNMHKTKVREDKLPTLNSMETYVRLWSILLIKVNKKLQITAFQCSQHSLNKKS